MLRNALLVAAALIVAAVGGYSQTGDKKKSSSGEVEMTFANGSVVHMKLFAAELEVITEFGKLSVPVHKIRRIDFGLHLPDGMDRSIATAVKNLGSSEFKEREAAVRELVTLGAYAYPSVVQAAKSGDPEISKNANDALAKIKAKVPAKELQYAADDKIVTSRFTIVGRIVTPSIKAKSEYFGDMEHSVVKLRSLRIVTESQDTDVLVDAARFAVKDQWMDTGIAINGSRTLSILAGGEVELRPTLPGTYLTGPRGYSRNVVAGGNPGGGPGGGGFKKKGSSLETGRAYPGTLLGRIGANGETFVIGDRFEATPDQEGKLFLQIMSSPYDTASTGSYQVKVSLRD
jgi:hypothetical protein